MTFDYQGYQQVLNQEQELQQQKQQYRNGALATVKELVSTFGFTAAELGLEVKGEKIAKKACVAPKYRTPDGFE